MRRGSVGGLLSVVGHAASVVHQLPQPIRARRHVDMLDSKWSQGIADGVDDSGAGGYRARLSDSLDAALVAGAWGHRSLQHHLRDLIGRRAHVIDLISLPHLTGPIVLPPLPE